MIMLSVYSLEQRELWDSIVLSFKDYDAYWLSGYVNAFKIHGDGEPILFYYSDESVRGINVVMKRDVSNCDYFVGKIDKNTFFDFSSPYGYGGWIIEGTETKSLFDAYENWVLNNGIICEFVRFHPLIKNHLVCNSFYDVISLGEVVHMELSSRDTIWNNITSKNRNMIRKAIKNGVKIYNGRYPEIYDKFRLIYNQTMDKDVADKYYYFEPEFYQSILDDLESCAQVFWAEKDGQIISASIILSSNGYLNYHLSGSIKEFSSLAPTNLLLFQVALWGCYNNFKTLYLGGGVGSENDSLFKFKRAFNKGSLNRFYIGKRIYDMNKYDELVNLRHELLDTNFFPKYREG